MSALMDLVVEIGKALAIASGPIVRTLGSEWMDPSYPGDPSIELDKKYIFQELKGTS